jgi:hypothetical protein
VTDTSVKRLHTSDGLRAVPQSCAIWRDVNRLALIATLLVAWAILDLPRLAAQASKHPEYEVKAAYLYNFGNFVEWPPSAAVPRDDAFTICVLGEDPFGPALDSTLAGETLNGKSVMPKRISKPQEAAGCRILFISSSEQNQLKEILGTLDKASVLTVSDMPQFVQRGGMVQFILAENRVRFEVNLATAERAGLTLSSQLLKLAISVKRGS